MRRQSLLAFALFLGASLLFFARGLWGHFDTAYVGGGGDPPVYMWCIRWWRYVFAHGVNPFLTDLVWAPRGFNLAWITLIPLPSWIAIPFASIFGEAAAYNLLCLIALPLAALSTFLLCRKLSRAFWPSILAGYIFGFSPYMLGELTGHLVLIAVFPIPLIVLAALNRLDGSISARRFTIEIAALLTAQFLCSVELFATLSIFGTLALMLAIALSHNEVRARLTGLIAPTVAGYAIAIAVISPYLYYMLAIEFPHAPIWRPEDYSADVLGFFVPTGAVWLGTSRAATAIAQTFPGRIYENGAYLGLPLILMVEVFRREYWRTAAGKLLTSMFVLLLIAAIGPTLHIAGKPGIPMPWILVGRLPLISIALPVRFMMYAFLVVAIMAAIWFTESSMRIVAKCALAALIVISIAPNPVASFWTTPLHLPGFFADGAYKKELSPREIILPVPFGAKGAGMYWQAESNMYFRMAGAWTGAMPFEFMRMPLTNYFDGAIDLPEAGEQLKAYVARFDVQTVIADLSDPHFSVWSQMLAALDVPPIKESGVWLYKIPPDGFAAYRNLSSAGIEARANALRFDAILEAAGNFLDAGNDSAKVSPRELKRLNLLPRDWLIDTTPQAFADWNIGAAGQDTIAIAIVGSDEGVKPLIDRYQRFASEILYPAPARWRPESTPPADVMRTLLLVFDRAHLIAVARQLKSSPPLERTTSFLQGVPVAASASNPVHLDARSSPISR
ncbi:MAG: hypothetical protein Q7S58_14955 [Candidatus Binatus sp.]|uniref:hypothetical protein n=1 Tax=Candidatus Binatus sp. TaxID=2811406 RepID=UPI00271FDE76|nr:hypothetical protein [Candidatus Binatus sp.]MDO8433701.1 hypothetical protein [Candidatus Binatus sp.]